MSSDSSLNLRSQKSLINRFLFIVKDGEIGKDICADFYSQTTELRSIQRGLKASSVFW